MFFRRRKRKEFVRACNVYCSQATQRAIVVSVYNHGGLYAEKPSGAHGCELSDKEELGRLIKHAMEDCSYETEFNYSRKKPWDWPAYRFSKCGSIEQFERDYARLHVRGANAANITLVAESPKVGKHDLRLKGSISAYGEPADIGEFVAQLYEEFLSYGNSPRPGGEARETRPTA